MSAIDVILDCLHPHKPHITQKNRWRARCPVCGNKNPNSLSISVTPEGVVLLKCFKLGCSPDEICRFLGLKLSDLFPPRESQGSPIKRPRLLSPSMALELIIEDVHAIAPVVAKSVTGVLITDDEKQAAFVAMAHMLALSEEALNG